MGRVLLIGRLAARDIRHRPTSAVLLVLAIMTAATTLTLALALRGSSDQPYEQAVGGPPADVASLTALTSAPGVVAHSGPYPFTFATLQANGHTAGARVEGRDQATALVDQPELTQGLWVRPGQVVLERSFADELGVGAGGQVSLNGRAFRVAGVAVTAASTLLYPHICWSGCDLSTAELARKVPGLVGAVLLAEHLILAVAAAAMGLLTGWLVAPLLTRPGAGLLGSAGTPPVTVTTAGVVVAVTLTVAAVATLVPAIRAARTSTVRALTDSARPPRRRAGMIAVSSRLPVPLLFGLRIAARRPRRVVLNMISMAVTATGIVAVLLVHASFDASLGAHAGLDNPQDARLTQVMTVLSVALVVLAGVNAILLTWATVLDARYISALARALGATPQQVSTGLSAAQVLPALAGALLGIPGGIGLYTAVNQDGGQVTIPPLWWLLATVLGTAAAVAAITAVPAWLGTRRPAGEALRSELA
jgi:hypothetical protein